MTWMAGNGSININQEKSTKIKERKTIFPVTPEIQWREKIVCATHLPDVVFLSNPEFHCPLLVNAILTSCKLVSENE